MTPNPYTQHWRRSGAEVLVVAIISVFVAMPLTCLLVSGIPSPSMAVLLLGVPGGLMFAIFASWYQRSRNRLVKVFYVRHEASVRIVKNVLTQKGMPFKRVAPSITYLPSGAIFALEDNLTINVDSYYYQGIRGSMILLGPVTDDNWPLVQSLQEKIDDAFAPKGL
jgi:hypothetical protein